MLGDGGPDILFELVALNRVHDLFKSTGLCQCRRR
jgi:hypothetical protein